MAATKEDIPWLLWRNVDKTDTCWLWKKRPGAHGYGSLSYGNDTARLLVHRISLELAIGRPLLKHERACHVCDIRLCVRNDGVGTYAVSGIDYPRYGHLWLGTDAANLADMVAKGRSAKGSAHSQSRLTESDVIHMRAIAEQSDINQRQIADMFHISPSAVSVILGRKRWAHI
jgi:hypothetical protein